ncbi:hypothetical protein OCK74_12430 [Chitinophagaceae bacterium LB-8]|uniref:Uncharacterized protein n=1 Tax=Paraflavisolibacter caeni TaxID=2982496 RepID=A0A9X2XVT1_9BACT|nr:hypothetical protein [Paraflavisolibacter caeni]MCU7549930.1 hypothetical protein [Paraflavisolibacter caeni]
MEQNTLDIVLELEQADLKEERKVADEVKYKISDDVKEVDIVSDSLEPAGFIEPVSVAITITITYLIKRLVDFWLKDKERGVQIDTREIPPTVSRLAGVPAGFLVIIDKNGNVITQKAEYEKSENLTELVSKALSGK